MTERERLIELLKVKNHCDFADCEKTCYGRKNGSYCMPEDIADHLLDNGVIVPPVKIGDTIYVIPSKSKCDVNRINGFEHLNQVYCQKVHSIQMWNNSEYLMLTCEGQQSVHSRFFGETWFLSREEAEKALKEREK